MHDDPSKISIKELISRLPVGQLWSVVGGLIVLMLGALSVGYWARGLEESANRGQHQAAAIVAEVFRSIRNERILYTKQESRLVIVQNAPEQSTIFIQLEQIPIPESIRLNFGSLSAPHDSYEVKHNILFVAAGMSPLILEASLLKSGVSISYVPDPDAKGKLLELKRSGDQVMAGNVRLYDGKRTLWPGGGDGPFGY